jgi:hypothetical protein
MGKERRKSATAATRYKKSHFGRDEEFHRAKHALKFPASRKVTQKQKGLEPATDAYSAAAS